MRNVSEIEKFSRNPVSSHLFPGIRHKMISNLPGLENTLGRVQPVTLGLLMVVKGSYECPTPNHERS